MDTIALWEQEIENKEVKSTKVLEEATAYFDRHFGGHDPETLYKVQRVLDVVEEANKKDSDQEDVKNIDVSFFGEKITIPVVYGRYNDEAKQEKLAKKLDAVVKAITSKNLYNKIVKDSKDMFYDVNRDSEFNQGKSIKTGDDLIKAIKDEIHHKNTKIFINANKWSDSIFFCGEYWCDPEHGWSIEFPKGNTSKVKFGQYSAAL